MFLRLFLIDSLFLLFWLTCCCKVPTIIGFFLVPPRTKAIRSPRRFIELSRRDINQQASSFPTKTTTKAPFLGSFTSLINHDKNVKNASDHCHIKIGQHIGSGSYGTVYLCEWTESNPNQSHQDAETVKVHVGIAKRAWTVQDLILRQNRNKDLEDSKDKSHSSHDTKDTGMIRMQDLQERVTRCQYYLSVEQHCLTKLQNQYQHLFQTNNRGLLPTLVSPKLIGRLRDDEHNHEWLVMEAITQQNHSNDTITTNMSADTDVSTNYIARSLQDLIDEDWKDQHDASSVKQHHHHLYIIQKEMQLPDDATFASTLDCIFIELLRVVSALHSANIVHRDLKPGNILLDGRRKALILIDYGSSADLDPIPATIFGTKKRIGLEDTGRVAVSPIYAAPEIFVKVENSPLNFDVFSVAMMFCQLLFNLLDERTDAAFRQQLQESNYDLDAWLLKELSTTMRPVGFDDALHYLHERQGLWRLIQDMLNPDPNLRVSSSDAFLRLQRILSITKETSWTTQETSSTADSDFFKAVVSTAESCDIDDVGSVTFGASLQTSSEATKMAIVSQPLHFIATFDRAQPFGLILSEADNEEPIDGSTDKTEANLWKKATEDTLPGDVFVRGIVDNSQASKMGIFRIGDRVRSVGELPVASSGFQGFLNILEALPRSSKTVKIYFDRKRTSVNYLPALQKSRTPQVQVIGQGAWSSKGRRTAQEDAFVLHEVQDKKERHILLAGVFDGHGGNAASKIVSQVFPTLFTAEIKKLLNQANDNITQALITSWDATCATYREGCSIHGSCIADYDPVEGFILAETGSKDLVAGTTASMAVIDSRPGSDEISVLNCGDSRTLVIGKPRGSGKDDKDSVVMFATRDHSPSDELEVKRLRLGKKLGLDYSLPECSFSRYWITVGDYQYAVSRSLEGDMATSKGIVSDADITLLKLSHIFSEGMSGAIILATDGIFEVLSDDEVGKEVLKRMNKMTAGETAKEICQLALQKGSTDNVSVIIIYLNA